MTGKKSKRSSLRRQSDIRMLLTTVIVKMKTVNPCELLVSTTFTSYGYAV
jgi:hypothetical protein